MSELNFRRAGGEDIEMLVTLMREFYEFDRFKDHDRHLMTRWVL